jgi:CheY-like chemotaxis protein
MNDLKVAPLVSRPMPGPTIPSQPLRVLCVDDEPSVLELLSALLSRKGYTVTTAGDGQEALRKVTVEGGVFDVYITDAAMPRLDGKGFLGAAVSAGSRAHLMVFSASFGAEDFEAFEALGAEIIKKPDVAGLLAAVGCYAAKAERPATRPG